MFAVFNLVRFCLQESYVCLIAFHWHLWTCWINVCRPVISSAMVVIILFFCVAVADVTPVGGRDLLVLHLPFCPVLFMVLLISCLLDQYLLCMVFSILSQHLKPLVMISRGTHPAVTSLFVQTAQGHWRYKFVLQIFLCNSGNMSAWRLTA